MSPKDDGIAIALDELRGVKYHETGFLVKTGVLEALGCTALQLKSLGDQVTISR